jgi:cytochrome c551
MKNRMWRLLVLLAMSACQSKEEVRKQQLMTSGLLLYRQHCQSCHDSDGKGLGKLYPPLAGSDYLLTDRSRAVCVVSKGLQGPVVVNGQAYQMAMPANPELDAIEISQVLTYVSNSWGNESTAFNQDEVQKALENCEK